MSGYLRLLKSCDFEQFGVDSENAGAARLMMGDLVDALDAQQKSLQNVYECLVIQHSLHGLKYPVVDGANRRKYGGVFVFIEHDERRKGVHYERQFYVFNDIVIVANLKKRVLFILDIKHIDIQFGCF